MNIMVERDTVVDTINKFIAYRKMEDINTLFDYLCEVKQIPNKDESVKAVTGNPVIVSFIASKILEELESHFNISRVVDKNNQLISVF